MVENESFKSISLSLLTRYLQEPKAYHYPGTIFYFVAPGNEIPEWYNHQSGGRSITGELHLGWFSNKWMGIALCAVFRFLKPLPRPTDEVVLWFLRGANGMKKHIIGRIFGENVGQPVLDRDHICMYYLTRDFGTYKWWQDIYDQLEFSLEFDLMGGSLLDDGVGEVSKCGFRMIYEEDAEELRQTLWNEQSNVTKQGLQLLL